MEEREILFDVKKMPLSWQEWILRLFRQYGYPESLTFAHFVEAYEFE